MYNPILDTIASIAGMLEAKVTEQDEKSVTLTGKEHAVKVSIGLDGKAIIETEFETYRKACQKAIDGLSQVPAVRRTGRIESIGQMRGGSAASVVRECQATEKGSYSVGGKTKAASAKTNIAALMEMGGSLTKLSYEHRPDYIETTWRAELPNGQHVDDTMSLYKNEYVAKKAWEWIVKYLLEDQDLVVGVDDVGLPQFKEGAIIKVRINDESQSRLVPMKASIAMWRELAREWSVAGRVAITKAKSRAADQLLRGDRWEELEEARDEQMERDMVQEKAVA